MEGFVVNGISGKLDHAFKSINQCPCHDCVWSFSNNRSQVLDVIYRIWLQEMHFLEERNTLSLFKTSLD